MKGQEVLPKAPK